MSRSGAEKEKRGDHGAQPKLHDHLLLLSIGPLVLVYIPYVDTLSGSIGYPFEVCSIKMTLVNPTTAGSRSMP